MYNCVHAKHWACHGRHPPAQCWFTLRGIVLLLLTLVIRRFGIRAERGPAGRRPLHVHRGFHAGAVRHLDEIVAAVRARDAAAGRRLPVWVAGHSLGGG